MSKPKARFESWLGVAALAGICLISLGNVIVRYTTNASFAFTEEFSVVFMVILAFAGAAVAARSNEHIRITLLEEKLSPRLRPMLYVAQWLGGLVVLGLIIWYGGVLTYEEYEWESTSAGLGYPTWIYQIWLPLLSLFIVWRSTQNLVERIRDNRLTPDSTTEEKSA
ncbi:TRAP transporter small permease [Thiopseudomonas alkaliphila]|uniref:TRAP transporter small permease protein n=1 Tax=Thiopseudomonas alkaliphila TaxID=1697053 RepID=A0A0K1XE31_9GAMM|nr:TRAP transporter small permease [Thiopseudomonas alkaliphila]AKX59571.1 C4-dicarboxylate ABC transporter permease [Thiopseudomonas alkaliphila]